MRKILFIMVVPILFLSKITMANKNNPNLSCSLQYLVKRGISGFNSIDPKNQFQKKSFKETKFCDDSGCQSQLQVELRLENIESSISVRVIHGAKVIVFFVQKNNNKTTSLTFGGEGMKSPQGMLLKLPLSGTFKGKKLKGAVVNCMAYGLPI